MHSGFPFQFLERRRSQFFWNGLEKYRVASDIVPYDEVLAYDGGFRDGISPREPFGIDISTDVERSQIKCKWIKLK